MRNTGDGEVILVGGLGTNPQPGRYVLGGRETTASSSLAALVRLGAVDPATVVVFTTEEGWEASGSILNDELKEYRCRVEPHLLAGRGRDLGGWFHEIRQQLAESGDGQAAMVVDLTGGRRDIGLLVFLAALAEDALGDRELSDLWYVPFPRTGETSEPMNLGDTVFLLNWAAGVRAFREEGSLRRMRQAVDARKQRLFASGDGETGSKLAKMARHLAEVTEALEMAAPLWVGEFAARTAEAIEEGVRQRWFGRAIAIGSRDLERARHEVRRFAGRGPTDARLDREELERELNLVQWYLDHDRPRNALLVLREWMVNVVIDAVAHPPVPPWVGIEDPEQVRGAWLDYDRLRNRVAARLSALAERSKKDTDGDLLQEGVKQVVSAWQKISNDRNRLAHAVFALEDRFARTRDLRQKYGEEVTRLRDLLPHREAWRLELPGELGRVVIQPVGHTPGLLTTTVRKVHPDILVVLCSEETKGPAGQILRDLGVEETRVRLVPVDDPFRCYRDAKRLAEEGDLGNTLLAAEEVAVVLTGGTSAMIALASQLGDYASRHGVPTSRWILVDERPTEEQRSAPLVVGEAIRLDVR